VNHTSTASLFDTAVQASGEGRHEEAEAGFRAVLAQDPDHGEALFGLGLSLMAKRRFTEAVEPLRQAVQSPQAEAVWGSCLAQALYMTADFAGSVAAFDAAERLEPLPVNAALTRAQAAAFAGMETGPVEAALDLYGQLAGPQAGDAVQLAREAFAVFTAFERLDAARAVGAWLERQAPPDVIQAYEARVLDDPSVTRAPADYVEALFDDLAERFDHQLVEMLDYRAPAELAGMLERYQTRFERVLDLGCGTGLSAEPLARFGGTLTGVDLSRAMLERAAARGGYAELVQADALAFLAGRPAAFDLVFAADVLIYFGDLAALFETVAAALTEGGYFVFSTELAEDGWQVLPSGRFAHARAYVEAVAGPRFEVLEMVPTALRREGHGTLAGGLYVLRRKA